MITTGIIRPETKKNDNAASNIKTRQRKTKIIANTVINVAYRYPITNNKVFIKKIKIMFLLCTLIGDFA